MKRNATSVLDRKIDGKMEKSREVKAACPLCGSENFTRVVSNNVLGKDFSVLECNYCSLLRTYPQIKLEEFPEYYTKDYSPYKLEKGLLKFVNKQLFRIETRSFRKSLNKGSDILEIGCSNGNLINYLKTQGYNVYGIEPGEEAAQRAREAGLDVETVSLEDFETDKKFDLIIMKNVLEHLANPIEGLNKVRNLLKPDGQIFCILPNVNSFERKIFKSDWYAWHIPYHCFHYNSKTIRLLAQKAGLAVHVISYSFLPIIAMWSIGSKLERKGYTTTAKYFQGYNPFINAILLPFSLALGLVGKSSEMSVVFSIY